MARRKLEGLIKFSKEFRRSKMGMFGLSVLVILVALALLFPYVGSEEDIKNWYNYEYWKEYPKEAPPCWAAHNVFRTVVLKPGERSEGGSLFIEEKTWKGYKVVTISVVFSVEREPPQNLYYDLYVEYKNKTYVALFIERPDGSVIELTRNLFKERGTSMTAFFGVPPTSYKGVVSKSLYSYASKASVVRKYILPWLKSCNVSDTGSLFSAVTQNAFKTLFLKADPEMITKQEILTGQYNFTLVIASLDPEFNVSVNRIVIVGGCYGLCGTDSYGRDLFQGILYGIRWALVIGLLVSITSTMFGGAYGVVSGYLGGAADEVMLRFAQVVYSIPVLPILILLSAILKPSIWYLILLLIIFGWPGIALVTRSMALQIKEETYVEAVKALGAGHLRVMFVYILPQILPYLFATIALSVPGAILTEAAISFLGLGDPTVITWGRILEEARISAATIKGLWWWVVPPGVMITIVGMTFILIGQAMDKILNPRLRR